MFNFLSIWARWPLYVWQDSVQCLSVKNKSTNSAFSTIGVSKLLFLITEIIIIIQLWLCFLTTLEYFLSLFLSSYFSMSSLWQDYGYKQKITPENFLFSNNIFSEHIGNTRLYYLKLSDIVFHKSSFNFSLFLILCICVECCGRLTE